MYPSPLGTRRDYACLQETFRYLKQKVYIFIHCWDIFELGVWLLVKGNCRDYFKIEMNCTIFSKILSQNKLKIC